MHLIYSTIDFKIGGKPILGFPIVLNEDLTSNLEVNAFLRSYLFRAAIESKKSWTPIARSLYDYFGFLESQKLSWKTTKSWTEFSPINAYRTYCSENINLARNTIRLRLTYIIAFYKYAHRRKWIETLPFWLEERKVSQSNGFLAHTNGSGGKIASNSAMLRAHKHAPKYLTKNQIEKLLSAVENPHHLMIIRFALQTGLRREELATFPLSYITDAEMNDAGTRNIRITLDPSDGSGMQTKGSRKRSILVSHGLMRDLYQYVKHRRDERKSSEDEPRTLFLNQDGKPWSDGGKGLSEIIKRLAKKVGLEATAHTLRHTYATQTLVSLQKYRDRNRIEPVVFLQKQLGHSSITTTMIYLHIVNEHADNAILEYDDELNEWTKDIFK